MTDKKQGKKIAYSAKECAYIAVFVALLIAVQLVLSALPGIELVSVFMITYAYVFGRTRSVVAALAFTLLRPFIFGVHIPVLILYAIYYPLLGFVFGSFGKGRNGKKLWLYVLTAMALTLTFSLLDVVISSLYFGYSWQAVKVYFTASIPVACVQAVCVALSCLCLFYPLCKAFRLAKRGLEG